MSKLPFKVRIRSGSPPIGTLVTLASPEVAETLSLSGLDWLFIDMEHGPLDILDLQGLVRATAGDCLALVRVPENSPTWIKRVLDTGCDGLIIPLSQSADDVRRAVTAAKYPPQGTRSVGVGRAHGYGLQFADYIARANDWITIIVQIEHIRAVEALDDILSIEGVDGILIGPYDLSGSLNHLGDITHPDVQAAIETTRRACRERGMPTGIFLLNPAGVPAELERGTQFLAVGTDLSFISSSVERILQSIPGR